MANTYTQITIQVVFSPKHRECLLQKKYRPELFKYITGILTNKGHKMLAINGVADHIHMLFGLNPSIALSDIVRDVKNNSSKFINEKKWLPGHFEWQAGYGGFSYSHKERPNVIRYIENQEEHHKTNLFRNEYMQIMNEFEISYSDQYLFDFIDTYTYET